MSRELFAVELSYSKQLSCISQQIITERFTGEELFCDTIQDGHPTNTSCVASWQSITSGIVWFYDKGSQGIVGYLNEYTKLHYGSARTLLMAYVYVCYYKCVPFIHSLLQ